MDAVAAAVAHRVELHRERKAKLITVAQYKAGLEAVRQVEEALEPLRAELGADEWVMSEMARAEGLIA